MKYVGNAESEFGFYGEPQHETRPLTDPEQLRVVDVTLPSERVLYQRPHYPKANQTPLTVEPLRSESDGVRIMNRQ